MSDLIDDEYDRSGVFDVDKLTIFQDMEKILGKYSTLSDSNDDVDKTVPKCNKLNEEIVDILLTYDVQNKDKSDFKDEIMKLNRETFESKQLYDILELKNQKLYWYHFYKYLEDKLEEIKKAIPKKPPLNRIGKC